MAFTLKDAFISVGGTALVGNSVTLDFSNAPQDASEFNSAWMQREGGLNDVNASVEFRQDFATRDAAIYPMYVAGNAVAIVFRPQAAAIAAGNPEYRGNAIISQYQPFSAGVGEIAQATMTLVGDGAWTRHTT